jgi:hypothetical protein
MLVLPPFQERPDQTPLRVFDAYDRFVAELQQETPARVEIFEGIPSRAPSDGMLLIARPHTDEIRGLIDRLAPGDPRPLLLNVSPGTDPELAQALAPAGIVLSDRYARWRLRQDELIWHHLYGLTSLASSLAPLIVPYDDRRLPSYSMYESKDTLLLPPIVARYIDAYWQSLG